MTADSVLLVVVGLVGGFAFGHAYAWRFARKLEHFEVTLASWDQPYDLHAREAASEEATPPRMVLTR